MLTRHGNPDREARAPRAPSTTASAVDGALVGTAGLQLADVLGPGQVLQLQRRTGNAAVARLVVGQRSRIAIQRNKESAALLTKLATPRVGEGQAIEVQTDLVDRLDTLIDTRKWSFKPTEFNLGGVLIDRLPQKHQTYMPSGGDEPDQKQQRRTDVQALYARLTGDAGEGTPAVQFVGLDTDVKGARAPGPVKYGGEVRKAGLGPRLVENALKTMLDAEQFEYLRLAGLPNDEWKILVEFHYIRDRPKDMAGFHKDTQGQSLFVNLNYHVTDEPGKEERKVYAVRGPEYVLNPPRSEAHDEQIFGTADTAGTLPQEFLKDLQQTRTELPEPTWIESAGTVAPLGYVAFVDEAVHHATPWFEGRYVTPTEFKGYLERKHKAQFDEIVRADKQYRNSNWPALMYPFPSYVDKSIIAQGEVAKWTKWLEMISGEDEKSKRNRATRYTREQFRTTMQNDEFDRMLEEVGSQPGAERGQAGAGGWFTASIPNANTEDRTKPGYSPVRSDQKPPLKRRASITEKTRDWPAHLPDPKDWPAQLPKEVNRRFIRTWVRAVPKELADSLRNS